MKQFLHFRCAGCNVRIKAPKQLAGQSRRCPSCGWRLSIQAKKPEDSDPLLVPGSWANREDASRPRATG